jgi:predicted amidohydrolase
VIDEKVDQWSTASLVCDGHILVGQKVDQHSTVRLHSRSGSITIGEKVDQHSRATLIAPNGKIVVTGGVDQHSVVYWKAKSIECPIHGGGQLIRLP